MDCLKDVTGVKAGYHLTLCVFGYLEAFFFHSNLTFFKKKHEYHQVSTVMIQIQPPLLCVLVWVHAVCTFYKQTTKGNISGKIRGHERCSTLHGLL